MLRKNHPAPALLNKPKALPVKEGKIARIARLPEWIKTHKVTSGAALLFVILLTLLRSYNDLKDAKEVIDYIPRIVKFGSSPYFPWIAAAVSLFGAVSMVFMAIRRDELREKIRHRERKDIGGLIDHHMAPYTNKIGALIKHMEASHKLSIIERCKKEWLKAEDAFIEAELRELKNGNKLPFHGPGVRGAHTEKLHQTFTDIGIDTRTFLEKAKATPEDIKLTEKMIGENELGLAEEKQYLGLVSHRDKYERVFDEFIQAERLIVTSQREAFLRATSEE